MKKAIGKPEAGDSEERHATPPKFPNEVKAIHARLDSIEGHSKLAAENTAELLSAAPEAPASSDHDGYVMAHKLYGMDSRVTCVKEMLAFLKRHPEVPNHPNGRRRMVHAGKFVNAIKGPSAFDYLDDAEPASIFGEVDLFIEGAAERKAAIRKRKRAKE